MGNIAKRPDGTYRARYRGPDKRERSKHFTKKGDAEKWLRAVETAKDRGEWVDPALAKVTVGMWGDKWLASKANLKPTTAERYRGILERQIKPTWGDVPLAQVTHADVVTWVSRLSASGLAAASVSYAHRVMSLLLQFAVKDGRIARNPADGVELSRPRVRQKRFLSHAEVETLATECGEYGLLIRVLAYTGLRWGEVAALQVQDVNLMRRRIHVRRAMAEVGGRAIIGEPKSHEQREVPLDRVLVDDLAAALAGRGPDALVFPSPDGAILRNGNFRRRTFNAAAERAGLVGLTPHGLRHTAASLAVQAGANVKLVQQMLGHAQASITLDVYSGLFEDDLDQLADRLGEARDRAKADGLRTGARIADVHPINRGGENAV